MKKTTFDAAMSGLLLLLATTAHAAGPAQCEAPPAPDFGAGINELKKIAAAQECAMKEHVKTGFKHLDQLQTAEGAWSRPLETTSVMYSCQVIFLYEYLGQSAAKSDKIRKLMNDVWKQQDAGGGFTTYPGGPIKDDLCVSVYVAARIAGEPETSDRMKKLAALINQRKSLKNIDLSLPYLNALGFNLPKAPPGTLATIMSVENHDPDKIPWVKNIVYPFLYLNGSGYKHLLPASKYPKAINGLKQIEPDAPDPVAGSDSFLKWLAAHEDPTVTLMGYVPATVPLAMIYGSQPKLDPGGVKLKTSLEFIERNELPEGPDAMRMSPGKVDIGETAVVAEFQLMNSTNPDAPDVKKAETFLYSRQTPSGALPSNSDTIHAIDSDSTGSSLYFLSHLKQLRGEDPASDPHLKAAVHSLLRFQNDDGGFGTWEKQDSKMISKVFKKLYGGDNLVLSESVAEQTMRVMLALNFHRANNPEAEAIYQRAMTYLLKTQRPDGSFPATWYVGDVFATSLAANVLASDANHAGATDAAKRAIAFVTAHQATDGGFSESVTSFDVGHSVPNATSSPAQTGMVMTQLMESIRKLDCTQFPVAQKTVRDGVRYLESTVDPRDGFWHDQTLTAVSFPRVEYLTYPYLQEAAPLGAESNYLSQEYTNCK